MTSQDKSDDDFAFFGGMNITALSGHKREKKTLRGPFHRIRDRASFSFSSWRDDFLPLYSWCALLLGTLKRKQYLEQFRATVMRVKHRHENFKEEIYLDHIALEQLSNRQFDFIFEPVLKDADLRKVLSMLGSIGNLPDANHWGRYQDDTPRKDSFRNLQTGYSKCFDHQSQESTDVRWLIVMTFLANQKLVLPPDSGHFEELIDYPNTGDMRIVRPFIRATEISLRNSITDPKFRKPTRSPAETAESVWSELHYRTPCLYVPQKHPEILETNEIAKNLLSLYRDVVVHFHSTLETTGIDPRHDTAFGLVLFAVSAAMDTISRREYEYLSSKLLLRTIVEAHINLRYLTSKDDETIWFQFRNYGAAQAKLSLLKYLDYQKKPDYIDMKELFMLANEDLWLEYQDISLGNWANKNLREIATEAGVKEVYDQHYQVLSIAAHAHWGGVRESVFSICFNPLHRFHRIPDVPRLFQKSLVPDMCAIINKMLDDLTKLYPPFKSRVGFHRKGRERKAKQQKKG